MDEKNLNENEFEENTEAAEQNAAEDNAPEEIPAENPAETPLENAEVLLEKLKEELAAEQDSHLRLRAEYQNYRNRTTEEKKKIYGDAKADCVKELLGVLDTFERALDTPCSDENYKKGIEMTLRQMRSAFEKLGVTEIEALGQPFDPALHNAIRQVDNSDCESDTVCEVFQKGYLLGERLLRPAMVAVAV